MGPSLTTAKSRLILGIDGLEPSIWGAREDKKVPQDPVQDSEDEEDEGDEDDNVEENDESDDLPEDSEDEDSENAESGEEDSESESEEAEVGNKPTNEDPPPPPYMSRAEELRFLQNAERLLSRTLAAADAEGNGISSELCLFFHLLCTIAIIN